MRLVGLVGRITGIAAGVLFIGGMFLPYLDLSSPFAGTQTHSYWELFTRSDVMVFVIAISAIDCLAIGLVIASRPLAALAAGLAGFAFGVVAPYDLQGLRTFGTGGWVMLIAAFVMLVGAVVAASAPRWQR
jgi:hypothetical protein